MSERPARRPLCTLLAGPNGSGKSSIYPLLCPIGEFINADVVAKHLSPGTPEGASIAAGRLVLAAIDRCFAEKRDFVYETTLSSHQSLAVMERCRALDYEIALVYVALDSPDLNVQRVAERVAAGGHHIEEPVIRRRYESAVKRLPKALAIADTAILFDNSGLRPLLLLVISAGLIIRNRLDPSSPLHMQLAAAAGEALQISTETVLMSEHGR